MDNSQNCDSCTSSVYYRQDEHNVNLQRYKISFDSLENFTSLRSLLELSFMLVNLCE
jgi:hypothetical protein